MFFQSMHVISSDFRKGIARLKIIDMDDLWYLSHIIDPGDFVTARTTRKIRIGENENAKTAKKTFTLKVEAETIEISDGGKTIRINGKVKEGTDEVPKDSYHAISLEEGSEFTLEKSRWLSYQKQKLSESSERKLNYLLCILDREEALLAMTQKKGYKILVEIKGDVPKKTKTVEVKKDFQQEIIQNLEAYAARYKPENIILASPAFYKEDLFKKINNPELKRTIILSTCSDVSESSLDEVMRRPELSEALKDSRSREEKLLVEELLKEISKDNKAAYGWKEVGKAIDAGAVSKLLITDKFLQQKRLLNQYEELDERMKHVDSLQGNIHIISSEQEAGRKIDGLGGIAALLRYKL